MRSRHVCVLAVAISFVLAPGWTVSVFAQLDIVASDCEEIASDMDFVNSMKLLVRQWSLASSTGDDAVMPAYRLDLLPEEQRALIVESLLSSDDRDRRVVLLRRRPTPAGDFVGRQVTISTSGDGIGAVTESWGSLLSRGHEILGSTEGQPNEEIYLATPEAVEGLEPDTNVVFFGIAP